MVKSRGFQPETSSLLRPINPGRITAPRAANPGAALPLGVLIAMNQRNSRKALLDSRNPCNLFPCTVFLLSSPGRAAGTSLIAAQPSSLIDAHVPAGRCPRSRGTLVPSPGTAGPGWVGTALQPLDLLVSAGFSRFSPRAGAAELPNPSSSGECARCCQHRMGQPSRGLRAPRRPCGHQGQAGGSVCLVELWASLFIARDGLEGPFQLNSSSLRR